MQLNRFGKGALTFTWLKTYLWGEVNQWSVEDEAGMQWRI